MSITLFLGIFLLIVKIRGVAWAYTAETLAILLVELIMFIILSRPIITMKMSIFIISLYPLTLLFVALLENVAKVD